MQFLEEKTEICQSISLQTKPGLGREMVRE